MLFKGEINPLPIIFEHMGNVSRGPPNKRPLKGLIYASFIHSFIQKSRSKEFMGGAAGPMERERWRCAEQDGR